MKKILFSSILLATIACNNNQKNTIEKQIIGNDTDKHGCKASTGENWSELQQTCVRLFEVGKRLNPVNNNKNSVISAFVLFNSDKSKVEIFLPDNNNTSIILTKTEENIYQYQETKYNDKEGILYINNTAKYKAE